MNTPGRLKVHKRLSQLIIVVGILLMIRQMYYDSEPGGIPILLVLLGTGWYVTTRLRTRSYSR